MTLRDSEFDRLVQLVQEIVRGSSDVQDFDAQSWLEKWLQEPVPALGNVTPREFLDVPEGFDRVCMLLRRMQSGSYS